jgi:hypothetical protein
MKSVTLRQHRKKDGKQPRAHTIAAVAGRVSTAPVTLPKFNVATLAEIEQKYGKL